MLARSKVGCCIDDVRKSALSTAVAFEVNAKVGKRRTRLDSASALDSSGCLQNLDVAVTIFLYSGTLLLASLCLLSCEHILNMKPVLEAKNLLILLSAGIS